MTLNILERNPKKLNQVTTNDKRYFPRWEVNKSVEYIEEGKVCFRSCTKDLSLDGAAIIVFGNPSTRHLVQVRIHLADKVSFLAQGRIAWSKSEPTHQLIGIVFDRLSKKVQKQVMNYAFELKNNSSSESKPILDRK